MYPFIAHNLIPLRRSPLEISSFQTSQSSVGTSSSASFLPTMLDSGHFSFSKFVLHDRQFKRWLLMPSKADCRPPVFHLSAFSFVIHFHRRLAAVLTATCLWWIYRLSLSVYLLRRLKVSWSKGHRFLPLIKQHLTLAPIKSSNSH